MEPAAMELAAFFGGFLRKGDPVLICFPDEGPDSLGGRFYEGALAAGGRPRFQGEDRRWKRLLRMAFDCRAGCIVAPPLTVLGLTKLARARSTPLYLRNVVTAQWACPDWMREGITGGLDCRLHCLEWGAQQVPEEDREIAGLGNEINRWTSVLDCRLQRGPGGLEIEIVVFPGEQLPKLPTCAKLIVRSWEPEKDEPFHQESQWKIPGLAPESH